MCGAVYLIFRKYINFQINLKNKNENSCINNNIKQCVDYDRVFSLLELFCTFFLFKITKQRQT